MPINFNAPSEFSGRPVRRNGTHGPPHEPTVSEALSLVYRTGDETGALDPDDGSTFLGVERPDARDEA